MMKLWSIWDEARYRSFQAHGFLVSSWEHVDPDDELAYRWIARFVPKRCVKEVPDDAELRPPVWGWAIYDSVVNPAPDLTDTWHLPAGTIGYCVELSMQEEHVLLSQFNMWVEALNGQFVVENDTESDRLTAASAALPPHQQQLQKQRTWPRMFDLEYGSDDYWGPVAERQIQACVQCIVAADVVTMQRFIAR